MALTRYRLSAGPHSQALAAALSLLACKERPDLRSAEAGVYRFGPPAPAAPVRIVSLAPSMTEVLFALGAGPRVAGVTRFCDYPPEAARLPKVGGFLDVSLEAVAALRPDLIVGVPNASNRNVIERLGELGFPVLLLEAHGLEDTYRLVREVGRSVGAEPAAQRLAASMRARVAAVEARVRGAARTQVLFAYGRDPLVVAGPGSFADELLRKAGADNVAREGTARYPTWSLEAVLVAAPDVIVDSFMGGSAPPDAARLRARWGRFASLPAVRSGRLHWLDPQLFARPGPRLVDALEALARLLHPERFRP
jgi:iron complex transport system substrate-binding protein